MRRTDEVVRTAYHEAGHVVAMLVLGQPLDIVSIRPSKHYAGITLYGECGRQGWQGEIPNILDPATQHPSDFRAFFERRIVVSLAGKIAGTLAPVEPYSGYTAPSPDEEFAERAAHAIARLSPRHRELVLKTEAEEASEAFPTDDETAMRDATVLSGDEASSHVGWLEQVARRLVHQHAVSIEMLAEALLQRPVLSGQEAAQIVRKSRSIDGRKQKQGSAA